MLVFALYWWLGTVLVSKGYMSFAVPDHSAAKTPAANRGRRFGCPFLSFSLLLDTALPLSSQTRMAFRQTSLTLALNKQRTSQARPLPPVFVA